ncbi:MAG: acetyl-CoA carboxylase biotin carboxyl carrier protein [Alphaproteobacteria bacterium]|nr:acetyl-CoA carboxylase biotin carboxyl carrier protein [Alphaproteobacteria bacterium]
MASASKKSKIDQDLIKDLADLLSETGLSEIEIEQSGLRVRVARAAGGQVAVAMPAPTTPAAPAATAEEASTPASGPGLVTSPMVGTVYHSSAPGTPAFVKVGDTVSKGQTLLIVEAMKTMNQIPSPVAGRVAEIFVDNSQPVEFGEPLMRIE